MSNDNGFSSFANIHYPLDRSDNLIMLFYYQKMLQLISFARFIIFGRCSMKCMFLIFYVKPMGVLDRFEG
jgi:hypothetical protein